MEEDSNKVGEVVTFRRRFYSPLVDVARRLPRKIRYFLVGLLVLLVVGGVGAGWYVRFKQPALIIGSERVSREDYEKLIKQAEKAQVSEQGAKKTIISSYKYRQVAKKLNITVDDEKMAELELANLLPKMEKNDFYRLGIFKSYIDTQIELYKQEGYEGYVFYYPFSRNFLDSNPIPTNPLFKNAEAIEKDRVNADKKAKDARTRLEQKRVQPQALVKEIKEDASLIYGNASNDTQHFVVNKAGYMLINGSGSGRFVAGRFMDILPGLGEGAVSALRDDVQRYMELQTNQIVSNNTAYYFVYKVKNLAGDKDIANKFNKEVTSIKVADNVKN